MTFNGSYNTSVSSDLTKDSTFQSHNDLKDSERSDEDLYQARSSIVPLQMDEKGAEETHRLASLSDKRKAALLGLFALANFIDLANSTGVAVAAVEIAKDTGLSTSQVVWTVTSYSLTFASFLLFAGRLSDLYPAEYVFEGGFLALGVLSLITSFVTHSKYAFLVMRGLGGIAGAMTRPSSYHLVVHMYPNLAEQAPKLAILSIAGGVGNVIGFILAGVCMLASYEWFFRLIAILCLISTALSIYFLPHTWPLSSARHPRSLEDSIPNWRKMDMPGVVMMMGFLVCLILSLTQGPIDGWGAASFVAPFIISWPLIIGFFVWESKIPANTAILPNTVWMITNAIIASLATLIPMGFYGTSQLLFANYWQIAFNWKPLHAAVALLPQGIMTLVTGVLVKSIPALVEKPRWVIPASALLIVGAEVLQITSSGGEGIKYWSHLFPAFILGSAGGMAIMIASSINFVRMCPPEMAGVAGAWTGVVFQVGGAITLAVQAGLESPNPTTFMDSGAKAYYFIIGWTVVLAGAYGVFYRTPKSVGEEHEEARRRIGSGPSGASFGQA
ncbi:hypothetical protein B9479_006207 [Cryptococcus floricola]|uniref:Major facilitator superfamily (MFS) profile domain-containing protein n=1 Tax=Cryptococcus floricola TaxID=2591691 RepID=A0A5D3ASH6_9TREE|nr:hypothetical protein B9479_006207 [Cryptococcus floricola]